MKKEHYSLRTTNRINSNKSGFIGSSQYKDIEKKVAFTLEGKHGMINVILPEKESTYEDWIELHQSIAAIIYRAEMNKKRAGD